MISGKAEPSLHQHLKLLYKPPKSEPQAILSINGLDICAFSLMLFNICYFFYLNQKEKKLSCRNRTCCT